MSSIFPKFSLNRDEIHWEDHLETLTPVELRGSLHFKRDDYFAPLGYGGINGSKLRQCIMLYKRNGMGAERLVSGTSMKSPQLPMGSAVARHFGAESLHIIGATKAISAVKRPMIQMASWFGATWEIAPVGYNPYLQKRCREVIRKGKDFYLEYGITADHNIHSAEVVAGFHLIGAHQVQNIPEGVTTLIVPAGSCNSSTSILLGVLLYAKPSLKRIVLIGIGPTKKRYLEDRLTIICRYLKIKQTPFVGDLDLLIPSLGGISVEFDDLHAKGIVDYQDERPFHYEGIDFHPTYEGKVMKYLHDTRPELIIPEACMWIVGSRPIIDLMVPHCPELGAFPDTMNHYLTPRKPNAIAKLF